VTSEGGSGSTMAWGKEADVDVSLYRFAIPEMTQFFALDFPFRCKDWKRLGVTVDQTFDAESGCHIRPDAELVLYPCFRVVPMGRIGHCFCAMRLWSVLLLRTPHGMMGSCVRRSRCLNWQTTELSLAFMLDNITVLGRKHDDVSLRCDALQKAFDDAGIPVSRLGASRFCRTPTVSFRRRLMIRSKYGLQ
jgi:hypothetical protein